MADQSSRPLRLCVFGASPSVSNLGVAALMLSTMAAVARRDPAAEVTVFDHGRGERPGSLTLEGRAMPFRRLGANPSRRIHRRDSVTNMRLSARLGGAGNPGVRAIAEADAVLDISGGDSFTDLYGDARFHAMANFKRLVLSLGTPLVLLPQTYGPYEQPWARARAAGIARGAAVALARDARSFEALRALLGDVFDPGRHVSGVDVAFALPRRRPAELPAPLLAWLAPDRARPVIGFNVSGLIYNQGREGSRQFGFRDDYREIVFRILRQVLDDSDANVVLVPHVLAGTGDLESDPEASRAVAALLEAGDRVQVLPIGLDAMETKWVISGLDFFCGTRMHSTVAGLSSGVPTAAIAYSKKTLGVFETCGQGDRVTDPRHVAGEDCVADVLRAWRERQAISASLAQYVPGVIDRAHGQFDTVFAHVDRRAVA